MRRKDTLKFFVDLANIQQIYDYDNLVVHVAYITILIPKQSKLSHIFTSAVGCMAPACILVARSITSVREPVPMLQDPPNFHSILLVLN